jgi:pyruvate,water dikinase
MKIAAGIITDKGGRTCHAAIVARELGIPAVVGATHATEKLKSGTNVTISCAEGDIGSVYQGTVAFRRHANARERPQAAAHGDHGECRHP